MTMKVIAIGRSSENDIVINDAKVSRVHLQLVQNDNGVCTVVDLNSANGTFVNGRKISGEVRLQAQDEIRIGDTKLAWREYMKPSTGDNPNPKPSRVWLYILACAVLIFLVAGIGFYFYYNEKKHARIEEDKQKQYELQKEQLRQEADQKIEEAKRLQDEADELFRQALISQSDKSKALAEVKQKEATEARKHAEMAIAAQRRAESARITAEKAKEEADRAKAAAEQNSRKAIRNAEENANKAIAKANTERDSANEKMKLTENFYEEYAVMKSDFAKRVCEQLQYKSHNGKDDAKTILKDLFNESDNKGKQAIVNAIQAVKQQSNRIDRHKRIIETDSLETSKNMDSANDKTAVESDE